MPDYSLVIPVYRACYRLPKSVWLEIDRIAVILHA